MAWAFAMIDPEIEERLRTLLWAETYCLRLFGFRNKAFTQKRVLVSEVRNRGFLTVVHPYAGLDLRKAARKAAKHGVKFKL